MKKMNKARKVSNPILQEMKDSISAGEMEKTRVKMGLAAAIDDLITESGMSKSAFAAALGKRPSEVTKWLSGTHNFTIETLVEIAEALQIPMEQLFTTSPLTQHQPLRITIHIAAKQSKVPFSRADFLSPRAGFEKGQLATHFALKSPTVTYA